MLYYDFYALYRVWVQGNRLSREVSMLDRFCFVSNAYVFAFTYMVRPFVVLPVGFPYLGFV